MHGGRGQLGPASPHFRTGEFSKLPLRYAAAFDAAVADPELTSLRKDLALLASRRAELLERFDTTESSARWKAAAKGVEQAEVARQSMVTASRERDAKGFNEAMQDLAEAVEFLSACVSAGMAQTEQWAEIVSLSRERREIVKVEVQRATAEKTSLTAEQATAIVAVVASLIRKFLPEGETYSQFAAELRQATGLAALN